MEQHNSKTRENVSTTLHTEPLTPPDGLTDVLPQQQGSLPEGGDFSSVEPTGGSKPDPVSTGSNVKDTIAGRN